MLVSLTVEDIMTSPVETVSIDATVTEAALDLSAADVGSLVIRDDGRPIGILTESDLVDFVATGDDPGTRYVRDIFSRELITAQPEMSIQEAVELLVANDIRRLPVCDGNGQLVGIVTTTDLSYYLPHLARHQRDWRDRFERHGSTSPSTTYDEPDWEFEHEGDHVLDVGDVVRFSKKISQSDIESFANATGDTNRLHLEESFAAQTRFGGRIAHGVLTAGIISAALARLPGLTIYLSQDLRFLGPVHLEETVTAVCEVAEDLGKDKYELTTTVVDEADEIIIDGEAVVLMQELPGTAGRQVRSQPQ
jgi:CBS domain-containing protein/acyl dehydratase